MNHLALLAMTNDVLDKILRPEVLVMLVAPIAIIGGIIIAVTKAIIHHRERMAKIERGIDPDAKQNP